MDTAFFRPVFWKRVFTGTKGGVRVSRVFQNGVFIDVWGMSGKIRLPLGRCSERRYLRVLERGGEGTASRRLVLKVDFDRFLPFNRSYKKRTHR